jgi:preprotein translocase subunit YajC
MLSIAYAQGTVAPSASAAATPSPLFSFMPLILMIVIFYFLLIRPQQKRQKEHAQMIASLKKNDEVITSSGIYGTIVGVKDDSFILRVDDNVKIEFQKGAITQVIRKA